MCVSKNIDSRVFQSNVIIIYFNFFNYCRIWQPSENLNEESNFFGIIIIIQSLYCHWSTDLSAIRSNPHCVHWQDLLSNCIDLVTKIIMIYCPYLHYSSFNSPYNEGGDWYRLLARLEQYSINSSLREHVALPLLPSGVWALTQEWFWYVKRAPCLLPSSPLRLEQLSLHGCLETHVLSTLDRKPIPRVVVGHLWDRHETTLEITEAEFSTLRIAADFHMHETSSTPEKKVMKESVTSTKEYVPLVEFL